MPTPPSNDLALDQIADRIAARSGAAANPASWLPFRARLDQHLPTLISELSPVYGDRRDFTDTLVELGCTAYAAWCERPAALKALDLQREADPHWFQSERMLGGVCYVDRFAGDLAGLQARIPYFQQLGLSYLHLMPLFECPEPNSDGGYAVSSYRAVDARLGDIEGLRALASALREAGISLVLDFIFNHTSDEHAWAKAAVAGEAAHADFYFIYPDRTQPDAFERTVREIFPDEHAGAFSRLADGRWVWTTFNSFQWDLNYRNPAVFVAMAGEMLSIANLGAEILRMDAVAFIWKELGTSCENLPQAHNLIRAFNAVARVAAPSLLFKSEAIVHPDDVIKYISPGECQLSYNPLQMALLWNTLATREVNLLQQALEERHALPPGTAWVNYVRSHDDIGWTFADEDAIRLGIQGFDHRQFLNRFYVNRFEGSFARGVPFQDNPLTGDCRICGTCASLCGLEQGDRFAAARVLLLHSVILSSGGMPLLYLGDEVGTLNDYSYLDNPAEAGDSRWVHRPKRDASQHGGPLGGDTAAGTIFEGLLRMVATRRSRAAFAGGTLIGFRSGNAAVLGYSRQGSGPGPGVLVLCNFSESVQTIDSGVLVAQPDVMTDLLSGAAKPLRAGLRLEPYEVLWLE